MPFVALVRNVYFKDVVQNLQKSAKFKVQVISLLKISTITKELKPIHSELKLCLLLLFLQIGRDIQNELEPKSPKPYLRICPADSNLICEEMERGSPFFNQFICGGGVPTAWHSMFIEVSSKAVRASGSSLLLVIVGGTKFVAKWDKMVICLQNVMSAFLINT